MTRALTSAWTLHLSLTLALSAAGPLWAAASGQDLIATYQRLGAGPFDAGAGGRSWTQEQRPAGADGPRSCANCHGADLTQPGRHATTGKPIEPMAVSVNPKRLSDPAQTEKWFGRNCRWTLGRECTPQEKGDFVRLIQSR
jgi:hypothetical protein